jgi:antitoxin (DNA-binding transcriptional repressor) of toxin-antitoxin stability system
MRITTIRELKHDTTTVLSWVAEGHTVEVRRRNQPVAILSPPQRGQHVSRPDFAARLRAIYGEKRLSATGTAVVSEGRGES